MLWRWPRTQENEVMSSHKLHLHLWYKQRNTCLDSVLLCFAHCALPPPHRGTAPMMADYFGSTLPWVSGFLCLPRGTGQQQSQTHCGRTENHLNCQQRDLHNLLLPLEEWLQWKHAVQPVVALAVFKQWELGEGAGGNLKKNSYKEFLLGEAK